MMRHFGTAAVIAVSIIAATTVRADAQQNAYVVTPLVSDQAGKAPIVDPNLKNAWGVAFTPAASPFWIADNATGLSTLYDGAGNDSEPRGHDPVPAEPRARIELPANRSADRHGVEPNHDAQPPAFLVPGTKLPASFIWATEDGTISAWTGGLGNLTPPLPPNNAVLAVDNSRVPNGRLGAVYKGLAVGVNDQRRLSLRHQLPRRNGRRVCPGPGLQRRRLAL